MDNNKDRGWVCPKCARANAPWVRCCDCNNYYWDPIYPQPHYPPYPYVTYYRATCDGDNCITSSSGTSAPSIGSDSSTTLGGK